jgi:hypothetical protein
MRRLIVIVIASGAILAGATLLPWADRAEAAPIHGTIETMGAAAVVGPAFVDSFSVTCATTATAISSSVGTMISYTCQTPASAETGGTTLVAVGDSGIADPAFATRNSEVYSGDTIRQFGGNARREYCRADTGTVTIFCRALVTTSVAP